MTREPKRIRRTTLDALRLTNKTIARGTGVEGTTSESFVYDALNRMTEATNNDTTVTMQYDLLGNLLQETQSGKSVQSVYNDLSFRTSLTYPNSRQITFTPDDLNRITHITQDAQHIAQYAYAGPFRVTQRDYLNGTSLAVDYDGGRRAISYTHSGSIGTFGYTYDKEDNKKYENRTYESKGDAYAYDEIYRLTGVKYGVPDLAPTSNYDDYTTYDSIETFGLDGVGNRISVTNGSTINYSTNNLNQYTAIDSANLDYDDNGNLISGTAYTHTFDYANRLLKVEDAVRTIAEFKYDALGRRYYKKGWDGSQYVETYFYYDGARCIEERNASDTMIAQYVFGNGIDEVLTMDRNSETYYYHENSLGSIYAVTTATGTVAERYSYDAYGNVGFYDGSGTPISQSAIGNRILFTGREYDIEVKLYHYRIRGYSADLGRFLQRDPAEDDNLLNLYAYVKNNPINLIDPFGLSVKQPAAGDSYAAWEDNPARIFMVRAPIPSQGAPTPLSNLRGMGTPPKDAQHADAVLEWLHTEGLFGGPFEGLLDLYSTENLRSQGIMPTFDPRGYLTEKGTTIGPWYINTDVFDVKLQLKLLLQSIQNLRSKIEALKIAEKAWKTDETLTGIIRRLLGRLLGYNPYIGQIELHEGFLGIQRAQTIIILKKEGYYKEPKDASKPGFTVAPEVLAKRYLKEKEAIRKQQKKRPNKKQ
ncbi:RHS repeat domain-containing protein [Planctomycetota bacterium]